MLTEARRWFHWTKVLLVMVILYGFPLVELGLCSIFSRERGNAISVTLAHMAFTILGSHKSLWHLDVPIEFHFLDNFWDSMKTCQNAYVGQCLAKLTNWVDKLIWQLILELNVWFAYSHINKKRKYVVKVEHYFLKMGAEFYCFTTVNNFWMSKCKIVYGISIQYLISQVISTLNSSCWI